jgi:hypothetical protein
MIWKLQITAVLDAYSMLDHLDGSIPKPSQFLTTEIGIQAVNPDFLLWNKKDKALLTLLYSTCSSSVLAMVVGKSSSQEVWNTLEERFTSTARSNVLNLKLELQSIKKAGNETVSSYLQRIKTVKDKLSAVGVHLDHEELIHVILIGLPKEYAPFASAIRTRDTILPLEKLFVLLQTEEQSMNETTKSLSNSTLAMFVSHNKPNFNGNQGFNRGRGRNSYSKEVEVEETQALIKALALQMPQLSILLNTRNSRLALLHNKDLRLHFKARVKGLHVRYVGK